MGTALSPALTSLKADSQEAEVGSVPSPPAPHTACREQWANQEQKGRGQHSLLEREPPRAVVGEGRLIPRPCMMGGSPASPWSLTASQTLMAYSTGSCRVHTAVWPGQALGRLRSHCTGHVPLPNAYAHPAAQVTAVRACSEAGTAAECPCTGGAAAPRGTPH